MQSDIIDKIRIDAELSKTSQGISDRISYQFFYPVDNSVPLATGILSRKSNKMITCKAADGYAIKGRLSAKLNENGQVMLLLFIDLGYDLQYHFEGIIFNFPRVDSDPPLPI